MMKTAMIVKRSPEPEISTELSLTDRLSMAASAPNGIKKMRELILELAVRGKLVPQDPKDEPASELLKRIKAEKEKLIKGGMIKKNKPLPEISEAELPYDLPKGWKWAYIGQISHDWGQKTPDKKFVYIDVSAIDNSLGIIKELSVLEPKEAPSRARKMVQQGTVIYSTVRPYLLNIAIIEKDFSPEPIASTAFAIIHPLGNISSKYLFWCLRSPFFIKHVEAVQAGIAYPAINDGQFFSSLIPIPPVAEENRIVAKVDELMVLCDRLEARAAASTAAHETLVNALLGTLTQSQTAGEFQDNWQRIAKTFNILFTTEASLDSLKQTILQLAVMGKLVPQDPKDEPASELLKRITTEKEKLIKEGEIKKEKSLPEITDTEKPFNLPKGWEWTLLPQVVSFEKYAIKRGPFGSSIKKSYFVSSGYKVYEQKHAINNNFFLGHYFINAKKFEELRAFEVKPLDIIVSCSGTVGKVAIAPEGMQPGIINQALLKISLNQEGLLNQYFKILFPAYFMKTETLSDLKGTAQKNIVSVDQLKTLPFPLPPIQEQERILIKVDELMALCDTLKEGNAKFRTLHQKLAATLVNEAVAV